jgi:hypothetical protein
MIYKSKRQKKKKKKVDVGYKWENNYYGHLRKWENNPFL